MSSVTISELFERHAERLCLQWVAGREGGRRVLDSEAAHPHNRRIVGDDLSTLETPVQLGPVRSLIGHLNLIHPHHIQVLGYTEVQYLNGLRAISREDALRQISSEGTHCVIVADDQPLPERLAEVCEHTATPLFTSALPSNQLNEDLYYYLSNLLAEVVTLHGVYMEVMSIGVLLTGASGVGKSELALDLIARGHRLIADDAPEFSRIAPDIVNGTCPKVLQDFLEVRGLGILNIRELFGAGALRGNKYLRLIVRLQRLRREELVDLNRLEGSYRLCPVLGLDFPETVIPVAPGRNLAVLVECAARNHILHMSGYDSVRDFTERQRGLIECQAQ